jgi:hypothetical protein
VTWTPEQQAQRDQWGLDQLDADPRNLRTVDPMDEVMRKRRQREEAAAAANGHAPVLLDAEGLPIPPDDVPLLDLPDLSVALNTISTDPPAPMLIDRLDPLGHTILYGTGGVGKGALSCSWIVKLVQDGQRVLILDYERHPEEWSRRIAALHRGVHDSDRVRHMVPADSIHKAAADIARVCAKHEIGVVVVDSAVMACGSDPLKPEAAADYAAAILDIGRPVLSLAHVTKVDDARYPFGSVFWHNLARMTWSLSGDDGEVLLKHRKHNNYQGLGTFSLTVTWSEEGQLREVWEKGYSQTVLQRALDEMPPEGATLAELQTALNDGDHKQVSRETLRRTLVRAMPMTVRFDGERYSRA